MSTVLAHNQNVDYQAAPTTDGSGSYTERKLTRLQLPPLAGRALLDLGCNAGFYCAHAIAEGARRAVGVDVDKQVIAMARTRHPRVEFHDEGWDALPAGPFDVVLFLSAIHYADDAVGLVARIRSEMAPTGTFVLEGGLAGTPGSDTTTIRLPVWREVGDRCRHLTHGYVARHLLDGFAFRVVGASEMRGGDPVPRCVIHATPTADTMVRPSPMRLDLPEYLRMLAVSAPTIVPAQPSYDYVRRLGALDGATDAERLAVLDDPAAWTRFVDDLLFAIGSRRPAALTLGRNLPDATWQRVAASLEHAGVAVLG